MPDQYCTFTLDDLYLGVPVEQVQEVIRFQEMTDVPLAPPDVLGLMNLRGQIVTALDLRRKMGLKDRAEDEHPMNVIIAGEDGPVSLLVDEIGDVLEVEAAQRENPPDTLNLTIRELVLGVYKLEGSLLLVLDAERLTAN